MEEKMPRKIVMLIMLAFIASAGFCQYQYWTNDCNTNRVHDLAFTATDIWCLANSPLRIDRSSAQITQLTHANSPLPEYRYDALATDPDGNVWFLPSSGGLLKYDGVNYTLYQPNFNYYRFSSLAVVSVNDIWLGSYYGLVHFNGSSFTNLVAPGQQLNQVCLDNLGRVWFWAVVNDDEFYHNVLFCHDEDGFELYPNVPDMEWPMEVNIVFDADNQLWVGTPYQGLAKLTGNVWTFFNTQNSGLLNNKVTCLGFDAAGRLWAGTPSGISVFDGSDWNSYTAQNSDWGNRFPYAMQIADDQAVWLATDHGLVKIADGSLTTLDTGLGGFPQGTGLMQAQAPNGDWYFLFSYALYSFNGNTWTNIPLPVADLNLDSLLFDTAGNLWLSGSLGLLRFDGQVWTHFTTENSGLPSNNCSALALDSEGCLWIGTTAGLTCYDGTNWQIFDNSNAPFPTNTVNLLKIDPQGRIWVSGSRYSSIWHGVAVWDGQDWDYVDVPNFGNSTQYILDIDWLDDAIYFSTGGGLAKLEAGLWTQYTTANSGIFGSWITSADIDSYGNLWLATSSGITRFDGSNWRSYRVANSGLALDYCRYLVVDAQDKIWVVSWLSTYLSIFDYALAVTNDDLAVPQVSGLRAWPNPFKDKITMELELKRAGDLEITVFNIRGQRVRILSSGKHPAGKNQITWDGRDASGKPCVAGIYLIKPRAAGINRTVKTLMLR